jgi:putative component of membrane protein insertase Oxa1/YidC/SpoIIIJ protein YidD
MRDMDAILKQGIIKAFLTAKKFIDNCHPFFYNNRANTDNQSGKR